MCNNSIPNLLDLTNHLRSNHNLTEKMTNLMINEKVIPQLSKTNNSSILKDNSNSATKQLPSIINISNVHRKQDHNTVTQIISNNKSVGSNQFISKAVNNFPVNNKAPKLKVIDYVTELKLINDYLKLINHVEGKLNEVKTIAGKCYLCENKNVFDLLQHFKSQHLLNINSKCFEKSCLLCGQAVTNRLDLIKHQFETHKIISFISLNKVFTLSKVAENVANEEEKQIENKINELKISSQDKNPLSSTVEPKTVWINNKKVILQKAILNSKLKIGITNSKHISALTSAVTDLQSSSLTNQGSIVSIKFNLKIYKVFPLINSFYSPNTSKNFHTKSRAFSRFFFYLQISLFKTKTYTCNECTMKFEDFYAYCSHLIKEHQNSTKSNVKCPICKNFFHRGPPYQNHIRTHLKICQIEVKRLNVINNKPRIQKLNENKTLKTEHTNENVPNVMSKIKQPKNIKFKEVKIVLNKLSPSKSSHVKKLLSNDIIVIDE